jgi:L-ascorbate metabolism protein UlaG (beta-lactamase superfamily)
MSGTLIFQRVVLTVFFSVIALSAAVAQKKYAEDEFQTSSGSLKISFIGHGSLMLNCAGTVIHVDPVSMFGDYASLPKADVILVTHEHGDHLDAKAIQAIRHSRTVLLVNQASEKSLNKAAVMKNGDVKTVAGITIEAVPAYNLEKQFHPKGNGNGYVIAWGGKRIYIGGDTENVPEIKALKNIDIAFLPMNLPFTMTPEQVADVAKAIRPKVLYPYHFGNTDTTVLVNLLKDEKGIEVRIRDLK